MLGTSSLLLLVAAPAKAGGSHQNIMLIMWEPLIMQELLISIMQEPKSGHSWTSKVFNTVITLDTYQFMKQYSSHSFDNNDPDDHTINVGGIQSHCKEITLWEIFMEQELRFGLDLGWFGNF